VTLSGVVVVGGSAGSHPALLDLIAGLPADLPAAVLVVIHIGNDVTSRLPHILSREGQLPVAHARDGAPLRNGRVLVAPPGFHLLVEDHTVRLSSGPRVNRVRPAVDVLFATAARVLGSRVTAVVLSGLLDDGAVGSALVSLAGGRVLVQAPDQAPFSAMPRAALAAAPGAVPVPVGDLAAAVVCRVGQAGTEPVQEVGDSQSRGDVMTMADSSDPGFVAEGETRLARLACPECGGAMAEVSLPLISYYRCHVGHQFSPQSLAAAQAEASEATLWSAVSALEEQAVVLRHLAEHHPADAPSEQRDGDQIAEYRRKAAEATELANAIRARLERNRDLP
jgi:two-component system chemotaxis response regulator CheB